jgi:integrase
MGKMRLFQSRFKDRTTGEMRSTPKWYLDFRDHLHRRQRIVAGDSETAADVFRKMIEQRLIEIAHREEPDREMDTWLMSLPPTTLSTLGRIGLIDAQRYVTSAVPLSKHLQDFRQWLAETPIPRRGRKRTLKTVRATCDNLDRVVEKCGFQAWADMTPAKVQWYLGTLTDTIKQQTQNTYMTALKMFSGWMVATGRAGCSDFTKFMDNLLLIKVTDATVVRGLDPDEARQLIEATAKEPFRYGLSGVDRAIRYLFSMESGLRVREMRSLTVGDFDFDEEHPYEWRKPAVRLAGKFVKNRLAVELPLRRDRAEQLRAWFANRKATAPAFTLPPNTKTARMIRRDLKAAGIKAKDKAGRVVNFHSLRHTLGNLLDNAGNVSLRARKELMRHSLADITIGRYTDPVPLTERRNIVERMPELPWPGVANETQEVQKAEKVG